MRTDSFDMFRLNGIKPRIYNQAPSHPGYHGAGESNFSITAAGPNRWQKGLTIKEPFLDIFVEVA